MRSLSAFIHKVTINTEYKRALEAGVFLEICPRFVETASEILERML